MANGDGVNFRTPQYQYVKVGPKTVVIRVLRKDLAEGVKFRYLRELSLQRELTSRSSPYEKYQLSAAANGKHVLASLDGSYRLAANTSISKECVMDAFGFHDNPIGDGTLSQPQTYQRVAEVTSWKGSQTCAMGRFYDRWESGGTITKNRKMLKYSASPAERSLEKRKRRLARQLVEHMTQVSPGNILDVSSLMEEFVSRMIKSQGMKTQIATAVAPSNELAEAMKDINYKAYLKEELQLRREHRRCVVAYSDGKRIAIGTNRTEVLAKIPREYKDRKILIQEIPDRIIKFHRPSRVRR